MTIPRIDATAQVWIGMVRLKGDRKNPIFAGCSGAYATFLLFADGRMDFREGVDVEAKELDWQCHEILWSEPMADRLERFDIDDYLLGLSRHLQPDGEGLFWKFHSWEREE